MCNSNEVYANPATRFFSSSARVRLIDDNGTPNPASIAFVPYICMRCGFTAMYVEKLDDIKELPTTKGWKQVV